ncbi:MAG: F0F1 ATP synthase subunit delta [Minwuia sp.]|uniref:F0F1 ATP synthase subunit delta n=1 Tax=Minwuia sp. TaxID=2493630 RepID=UPI003A86F244
MAADHSTISGISGRYATALFELANEQGSLDDVKSDLAAISAMLDESADLQSVVRSPVISRDDQAKAMAAVLDAAGTGQTVKNFVGVVAQNRRLFALRGMIRAYNQLLSQHRGEIAASVTSAQPLSDEQQQKLADALKQAMGRDVNIETSVDEGLIGGMIVRVGSRMVDFSLSTKLAGLRLSMKGVG